MRKERGSERAHCSWRMRPVSQKQVRFCPKVVIRPHKHSFNMQTHTHTHKLTQAALGISGGQWQQKKKKRGLPQLFGIVLLNLRPLLHKFHVLLHQLQARLCMLLNRVILVLEKAARETNKEKISSQDSAGNGTRVNSWVITGILLWLSRRSSELISSRG